MRPLCRNSRRHHHQYLRYFQSHLHLYLCLHWSQEGMRPLCRECRLRHHPHRSYLRHHPHQCLYRVPPSISRISALLPSLTLPMRLGSMRVRWTMRWYQCKLGCWKVLPHGSSRCPESPPCRPCTRSQQALKKGRSKTGSGNCWKRRYSGSADQAIQTQ